MSAETLTLVIAEPGCTAEGDYDRMLRLLHTAKDCGANVWKPQFVSNVDRMLERRHITRDHPKYDYYKRAYSWLAWPAEWLARFREECASLQMQFACTVFLPEDAATVAPFLEYLKVSSFEVRDKELYEAVYDCGPDVIFSSGMDGHAPDILVPRNTLHCVSAYPAPLSAMNLAVLKDYAGLSDHSRNVLTGAVAVGAGARIIETHYRLDDCDPENPDYPVAFTPAELATYISNIRQAEIMMGTDDKTIQPCEEWGLPYRVGV